MSHMDGVVNFLVSPKINERNTLVEEGETIIGTIGTLENETNKEQMMEFNDGNDNQNKERQEEPSKPSNVKTIGLEDDRRTEEVLRDLGLSHNGPNINSLMYKAYPEWSQ